MIQITSITRGYATAADRKRARAALANQGYDHFVPYRDTASAYALCYGTYMTEEARQVMNDTHWHTREERVFAHTVADHYARQANQHRRQEYRAKRHRINTGQGIPSYTPVTPTQ